MGLVYAKQNFKWDYNGSIRVALSCTWLTLAKFKITVVIDFLNASVFVGGKPFQPKIV
jgi:hypothetical protein